MTKKIYYHGSKNKLNLKEIDFHNVRLYCNEENGHDFGYGFYLTDDLERAKEYGENILKVEFTPKKELSNNEKHKLSVFDVRDLMDVSNYFTLNYDGILSDNKKLDLAFDLIYNSNDDVDVIHSIINAVGGIDDVFEWLIENDFSHSVNPENNDIIIYDIKTLNEV